MLKRSGKLFTFLMKPSTWFTFFYLAESATLFNQNSISPKYYNKLVKLITILTISKRDEPLSGAK